MIGFVLLLISIFTFSLSPFVWGAMLMISGISFGKVGDRNSTGSSSVDITKMSSAEQAKFISELTKDKPKNERASVVGRAVVGGVIAGGAGAVVGALSAIDENNRKRSEKDKK